MADHAQRGVFLALYRDIGLFGYRNRQLDPQPFAGNVDNLALSGTSLELENTLAGMLTGNRGVRRSPVASTSSKETCAT